MEQAAGTRRWWALGAVEHAWPLAGSDRRIVFVP
jgi:hypothetical protein